MWSTLQGDRVCSLMPWNQDFWSCAVIHCKSHAFWDSEIFWVHHGESFSWNTGTLYVWSPLRRNAIPPGTPLNKSHIFKHSWSCWGRGASWRWGWSETRYGEANKWGPNVLTHTINIQNYKSWAQEWGLLVHVTFSGCTSVLLQAYSQICQSIIDYSFRSKWLKFRTFLHHPLWLHF